MSNPEGRRVNTADTDDETSSLNGQTMAVVNSAVSSSDSVVTS